VKFGDAPDQAAAPAPPAPDPYDELRAVAASLIFCREILNEVHAAFRSSGGISRETFSDVKSAT
jgi:hypothetical protein